MVKNTNQVGWFLFILAGPIGPFITHKHIYTKVKVQSSDFLIYFSPRTLDSKFYSKIIRWWLDQSLNPQPARRGGFRHQMDCLLSMAQTGPPQAGLRLGHSVSGRVTADFRVAGPASCQMFGRADS